MKQHATRRRDRRGFTLIELGAVVATVAAAGAIAVGLTGQPDQPAAPTGDAAIAARQRDRQIKDATQLRGILQGCMIWAQNNKDQYPLPSLIDKNDDTVNDRGHTKDTSANIMSILVFNGFVPTDMLVSPVEKSPNIKAYDKYEFDRPARAAKPAGAIWDPAFSADFTNGKTGGLSYAHLQPSGDRAKRWAGTFMSNERVISMRGPEVKAVTPHDDGSVTPQFANEKSVTFGLYATDPAGAATWSGNIAYNDAHCEFSKDMLQPGKAVALPKAGAAPRRPQPARKPGAGGDDAPKDAGPLADGSYTTADGARRADVMFYDETDDPKSFNDYLGIFTKAGERPKFFTAIWD